MTLTPAGTVTQHPMTPTSCSPEVPGTIDILLYFRMHFAGSMVVLPNLIVRGRMPDRTGLLVQLAHGPARRSEGAWVGVGEGWTGHPGSHPGQPTRLRWAAPGLQS